MLAIQDDTLHAITEVGRQPGVSEASDLKRIAEFVKEQGVVDRRECRRKVCVNGVGLFAFGNGGPAVVKEAGEVGDA